MTLGERNQREPNVAEFLRGNEGAQRPTDLAKRSPSRPKGGKAYTSLLGDGWALRHP